MRPFRACLAGVCLLLASISAGRGAELESTLVQIGLARVDITPSYAVRLTGYGSRTNEAGGTDQQLWAKALAIGEGPAAVVVITVDNLGIPAEMTEEVARRLDKRFGLKRERLAICASHTHYAPALTGMAKLILKDLTAEQSERIARYSAELTDAFERVAAEALESRRPGRLGWCEGRVGFAGNRRTLVDGLWKANAQNPEGLVDHSLPTLVARDPDGKLRGVLVNYACHCTTINANDNKYCGDWAGFAQETIERSHPGTIAMVAIGCGADANPYPRGTLDLARDHGQEIAREVDRLLEEKQLPLGAVTAAAEESFDLPFAKLPTRAQWEERAKQKGPIATHAQAQLARLDRGEQLPQTLPYRVETWDFGGELAMIFLPGEVTVEYALRLKREHAGKRLWVSGYSNDEPCYIASRRLIGEGGYEVESSMWYYDRPTHFAPEVEDMIVGAVERILPEAYRLAREQPVKRWQAEIEKLDAKQPGGRAPEGSIVFVGSSTIRRWDLLKSFPDLPVVNHGFGGSQYADAVYFLKPLVEDAQPSTVVLYDGDNDLAAGKPVEQVAADAIAMIYRTRLAVPEARIIVLSVKPSPKRRALVDAQRKLNAMLEGYVITRGDKRLSYVDVGALLLGSEGEPRSDLFVADQLHLNDQGYALWAEKLRPILAQSTPPGGRNSNRE